MTGDDKNNSKKSDSPKDSHQGASGVNPKMETIISSDAGLSGDARILYEAYREFSKNGVTKDEKVQLSKIDEVLQDASIQTLKNGGAIITDSKGNSTRVK